MNSSLIPRKVERKPRIFGQAVSEYRAQKNQGDIGSVYEGAGTQREIFERYTSQRSIRR